MRLIAVFSLEGGGRVGVCTMVTKKILRANATKGFPGMFLQILPYFERILSKTATFRYYIHALSLIQSGILKNVQSLPRAVII